MTETVLKSGEMNLVLLGVNHKTAPVEVRERLAIPAARLAEATRSLIGCPGVREGMILSTCNRVELVTCQEQGLVSGPNGGGADLQDFIHSYFAVEPASLRPHLYEYRANEAVRHLFRVAASLDSMVLGEPQILGQVKESYSVARSVGAVQANLDGLLQRAFTVAKRVRTETQIGSSSVSIASVAVELARKIFGSLDGKRVLLVGAGKMSELAARHLIQQGASSIVVANRTQARAVELAAEFGGAVIEFDRLYEQADQADIVISSTGAAQPIFRREHGQQFLHRRKNRPMFFIDIAVPRDVHPEMNRLEGIFVYDIDDLQSVTETHLAARSREAEQAEGIIAREVERYQQRLQSLDGVPVILELQESLEEMRVAEIRRVQSKLGSLTAEQQAAIDALTRSLVKKVLHTPVQAIRSAAREGDRPAMTAIRNLFRSSNGSGGNREAARVAPESVDAAARRKDEA